MSERKDKTSASPNPSFHSWDVVWQMAEITVLSVEHSFPIFVWDIVWKHLRDLRGIPNKKRESREEILPRQRPNLLNAFSQVSAESPRVLTHGGPYDLTTNNQQKNSKWKRCWSSGRSLHNALGISPAGPRFMSQHSSLIWDLPEIPFTVSKDMPADSQSLKM